MLRVLLSGCNGYMGRVITAIAQDDPDVSIVAGVDIITDEVGGYPVYPDIASFSGSADVIVDFSIASALSRLLDFAVQHSLPLVLCATGYSKEQIDDIEKAAAAIPVFRSGNMSLGINLLIDLVKRACSVLGDSFDVEIVERHHRRKLDAPSGTAIMLADAAASALPYDPEYVFERESRRQPRGSHEIGISALRGGSVVGVHEVVFSGLDEVIELKHTAASRDVFAVGAIRAAKFLAAVGRPGLFDMTDLLGG